MEINKKDEYIKFMTLIRLRYNIGACRRSLAEYEEWLKNDPNNYLRRCKYEAILEFYNKNISIAEELFDIDVEDPIESLNEKLCIFWPNILEGLKNNTFNYEWTIKDFQDSKYYDIYKCVNSYDVYWKKDNWRKDTDPIYFELDQLKYLDDRFMNIFEDVIENELYNPNKRTMYYSRQPFWAWLFPVRLDNVSSDKFKKVFLDKRCDYRVLNNGTDKVLLIINWLMDDSENSFSSEEKEFFSDFIYKVIKDNNCSILQDYVEDAYKFESSKPLIYPLFGNEEAITMHDKISSLYDYCISEDGVINQCKALEDINSFDEQAIDFYISLIEKDNPKNEKGITLLKSKKFNN